jgi:hypothetical protein
MQINFSFNFIFWAGLISTTGTVDGKESSLRTDYRSTISRYLTYRKSDTTAINGG